MTKQQVLMQTGITMLKQLQQHVQHGFPAC